jgi:hypothetical protein
MRQLNRNGARVAGLAFALAIAACAAFPISALAKEVTVRVEGQSKNLLPVTTVQIGDGSGTAHTWNNVGEMPHECADDTAYQAIELATEGQWDREEFITEVLGEEQTWFPNEEYWILYYDNDYATTGVCQKQLEDGDTVLVQAGVSGDAPDFVPESVPIAIDSVEPPSREVELFEEVTVHLTAWIPPELGKPSNEVDAVGYTVTGGGDEAITNASGEATLLMEEEGSVEIGASMPGSEENWSRAVPVTVCVEEPVPC